MRRSIGVLVSRHIWVGMTESRRLSAPVKIYPEPGDTAASLRATPADELVGRICREIAMAGAGIEVTAAGLGFPGIVRAGVVEESPNLQQFKGYRLQEALVAGLRREGLDFPALVVNDADAIAAGIAASRGEEDRLIRVWNLGDGVGYGCYPRLDRPGEGGHTVVTLEQHERFCGCGGVGHLEGVVGHRSIRLRFLDMDPEEIFQSAKEGDAQCIQFVKLWHAALAAASATSIHLEGAGKFFLTGPNSEFVDLKLLDACLHEMVTMSSLQGSSFEIVSKTHEMAIIGAARVSAESARTRAGE